MSSSSSQIQIFNNRNEKILTLKVIQETPTVKAKVIRIHCLYNQIVGWKIVGAFDNFNFPFQAYKVGHIYTIKGWDKTQHRFTGTIIKEFSAYHNSTQYQYFAAGFQFNFKNGVYHGPFQVEVSRDYNNYKYKGFFYNGLPHRYIEEKIYTLVREYYKRLEFKNGHIHGKCESRYFNRNSAQESLSISYYKNDILNGIYKRWEYEIFTLRLYKNNKINGLLIYKNFNTGLTQKEMFRNGVSIPNQKRPFSILLKNKIKIF
jgi:hypothetical protein